MRPQVPTLYTTLDAGTNATDPNVYGQVNLAVTTAGPTIEIVLNNLTPSDHPFHLHGGLESEVLESMT